MTSRFVARKVATNGDDGLYECLQSPLCRNTSWVLYVFSSAKPCLVRSLDRSLLASNFTTLVAGTFARAKQR